MKSFVPDIMSKFGNMPHTRSLFFVRFSSDSKYSNNKPMDLKYIPVYDCSIVLMDTDFTEVEQESSIQD